MHTAEPLIKIESYINLDGSYCFTIRSVPSKHVLKGPGIYFSGKPGWESSGFVHGFAPGPFSEYR